MILEGDLLDFKELENELNRQIYFEEDEDKQLICVVKNKPVVTDTIIKMLGIDPIYRIQTRDRYWKLQEILKFAKPKLIEKAEELRKKILGYYRPHRNPDTGILEYWKRNPKDYHKIKSCFEEFKELVPDYIIYEDDDGSITLKYFIDLHKKAHDNKRKPGWDI